MTDQGNNLFDRDFWKRTGRLLLGRFSSALALIAVLMIIIGNLPVWHLAWAIPTFFAGLVIAASE